MPNLLHFFEGNGTMLSNHHTPLIAHTADDILTSFSGLYGDRQGMPVSNGYQVYNTDGPGGTFNTTDKAGSFAYWTDPVYDTASVKNPNHDESATAGDAEFTGVNSRLFKLEKERDALAILIKDELFAATFHGAPVPGAQRQVDACHGIIAAAARLASSTS